MAEQGGSELTSHSNKLTCCLAYRCVSVHKGAMERCKSWRASEEPGVPKEGRRRSCFPQATRAAFQEQGFGASWEPKLRPGGSLYGPCPPLLLLHGPRSALGETEAEV